LNGTNLLEGIEMTLNIEEHRKVKVFALSTCGWCKRTRKFLDVNNIPYETIDIDLLKGEEREQAREELSRFNPRRSYPTTVIDDHEVVMGFDEERLIEILSRTPCAV
jgi:glutaredoxin